ncbi:MAG: hypothetical protein U5L06_02445 [Rhodovibrio sp.]|nr:hypothetical protein [Rhodovibrio sp.]
MDDAKFKIKSLYKKAEHIKLVANAIELSIIICAAFFVIACFSPYVNFNNQAVRGFGLSLAMLAIKLVLIFLCARNYNITIYDAMHTVRLTMLAWTAENNSRKKTGDIPALPEYTFAWNFRWLKYPRRVFSDRPLVEKNESEDGALMIANLVWPSRDDALPG